MSGQKGQPSVNLLFSPTNDIFTTSGTSALLMPVEQTAESALMTSENIPEADNFLGQSESEHPAVFSLFSGSDIADPFAAVGQVTSDAAPAVEQKPSLMVPSADSPSLGESSSYSMPPSISISTSSPVANIPGPPPQGYPAAHSFSSSSISNTPVRPFSNSRYVLPNYSSPAGATPPFQSPTPHSQTQPSPYSPIAPPSLNKLASSVAPPPTAQSMYLPVTSHWCYCKILSDGTDLWKPFSYYDSQRLEEASTGGDITKVIPTDGGRYDVDINDRSRNSIYWEEPSSMVRRCTWFGKGDSDYRYKPFEENVANMLEKEYQKVVTSNIWHKQIDLDDGEMIVIHNPQVIVHLVPREEHDQFGSIPEHGIVSRIVKRGISEIDLAKEIPENEIGAPDHVVFVCNGIGSASDLKPRTIVECVDDFRSIQLMLLKSHFKKALESKQAQRIEFIPVHWHRALHGNASGVDRDIRRLTLPSIQRLRQFTNEVLLDILFYSSPVYCQTIAETIGSEINSLHRLFLSRTPGFKGNFSVAGHSLGALMLFDLLCNQKQASAESCKFDKHQASNAPSTPLNANHSTAQDSPAPASPKKQDDNADVELHLDDVLAKLSLTSFKEKFEAEQIEMETLLLCSESDLKDLGLPMGPRKKLVGYLKQYQEEKEKRKEENAIAVKHTIEESVENTAITPDHFHMDSMASLTAGAMNVHVDFQQFDSGTGQPMVIYPRLLFEPSQFFALGSPISMFLTVRGLSDLGEDFCLPTCGKFFNVYHPYDPVAYRVEPLISPDISIKPVLVPHYKGRKRLHLELRDSLGRMGTELKQGIIKSVKKAMESMQRFASSHWQSDGATEADVEEEVLKVTDNLIKQQDKPNENDDASSVASESSQAPIVVLGKLNGGRRIDYVLQERPLESFNDYLFAFQSHLCYWTSEDTVLLMIKEIYNDMDVMADSQMTNVFPVMQTPTTSGVTHTHTNTMPEA